MTAPSLLAHPICRAEQLGLPIPDSTHAVSVALPRWDDVVGYEEKRPDTLAQLRAGYPRFVIHPLVAAAARAVAGDRPALPFPSHLAAQRAAAFIRAHSRQPAEILSHHGLHATATTREGEPALRAFWQHAGLILSTRQAEAFLESGSISPDPDNAEQQRAVTRQHLADWYDCDPADVFLAPSGMAAILAALRACISRRPNRPTAQLGFPYADTLKLQQRFGHGATLLHDLATIADDLDDLARSQPLAAAFCEIPGNPLLGSADVRRVSPILRAAGVPLVADDVVATPANIDLRHHADLVATSLTKFAAGSGDVMGGATIANPRSPLYGELAPILRAQHEELLSGPDAAAVNAGATSFHERMQRHNRNGLLIAERLRSHPAIERVWYPKWEFAEAYDAARKPGGGYGALVTFLPKNAAASAPRIYDALEVCKGPSLGTSFTLACPFTLLAHYSELDWAESCGLSRHLIRLSVGLEDPDELWHRLLCAIEPPTG